MEIEEFFLANHFEAKKIILFGMDFGKQNWKILKNKKIRKKNKINEIKKGEYLLEWLSTITKSELFTTSKSIRGFEKISYKNWIS